MGDLSSVTDQRCATIESPDNAGYPRWISKHGTLFVYSESRPQFLIYENAQDYLEIQREKAHELAIDEATANQMMWPVPLEVERGS